MIRSFFSLRKSKRAFRQFYRYYIRRAKSLDERSRSAVREYLEALRSAILNSDSAKAKQMVNELEQASLRLMPKSAYDKAKEFLGRLFFALFVAILIRTTWFELYTIPSGSMRPTLKEEDYLIVSKTDYGINVPLQEKHFYFDPNLVKRGSIVVFNSANIDIADSNTVYFYLFPGKKQFVKRLIGKPGDILYFYGGQIYGIDAQGNPLSDLASVNQIEHIPFIRFDGKVETIGGNKGGIFPTVLFHQMNQPVAKLHLNPIGKITGEMLPLRSRPAPNHYSDLWGMKHFAMARLLNPADMKKIYPSEEIEEAPLYLELTHHPSLQGSQLMRDEYHRMRPDLAASTSLIPLQQPHLKALSEHMTTCRFSVKNGIAWRLGWNPKDLGMYLPHLPNVPDGTYEIIDGKAYRLPFPRLPIIGVFTNGVTRELPPDHPLYSQNPEMIYKLYNLGIEFLNPYQPVSKNQHSVPSRYAYFKNEDLYLMGAPIFRKQDPILERFLQKERQKQTISTTLSPYFPFEDKGPPSLEEIRKHGIQVPEKMYLVLGDNHAMSADSRQFGFVPENNLKGGVSFIFSPPGSRWGRVPQPEIPHATLPNLTIWALFSLATIGSAWYYRRQFKNSFR